MMIMIDVKAPLSIVIIYSSRHIPMIIMFHQGGGSGHVGDYAPTEPHSIYDIRAIRRGFGIVTSALPLSFFIFIKYISNHGQSIPRIHKGGSRF